MWALTPIMAIIVEGNNSESSEIWLQAVWHNWVAELH